jgi:hypothetical protein
MPSDDKRAMVDGLAATYGGRLRRFLRTRVRNRAVRRCVLCQEAHERTHDERPHIDEGARRQPVRSQADARQAMGRDDATLAGQVSFGPAANQTIPWPPG